jgi:hypothetical protein
VRRSLNAYSANDFVHFPPNIGQLLPAETLQPNS